MKQLLIAMAMMMVPVMGAGGEGIKGLRPSLEVKLVAEWRYAGKKKGFVSFGGGFVLARGRSAQRHGYPRHGAELGKG